MMLEIHGAGDLTAVQKVRKDCAMQRQRIRSALIGEGSESVQSYRPSDTGRDETMSAVLDSGGLTVEL